MTLQEMLYLNSIAQILGSHVHIVTDSINSGRGCTYMQGHPSPLLLQWRRYANVLSVYVGAGYTTYQASSCSKAHLRSFCRSDSYMNWSLGLTLGWMRGSAASKCRICTQGAAEGLCPSAVHASSCLRASCRSTSLYSLI